MATFPQDRSAHNRTWATQIKGEQPGFFTRLDAHQSPKYLAMDSNRIGMTDHWLRRIKHVRDSQCVRMAAAPKHSRQDVVCELNAMVQVVNVAQTTVMQVAWLRKQLLTLHGWFYALKHSLLIDSRITVSCNDALTAAYSKSIQPIAQSNLAQQAIKLVA